ncbi:hypothetical protein M0813_26190 [Anaeramoeba flamelloides]|uniref:Uncharacterized protein n=1 Tax=Anaeramoeba flamelloides TaxID=1746091 RepID=A0ABQ8Y041_9EUKA|nr:hypothetical protein M0813_26190 [Anaeramoeba flamelloides]
MSEKENNQTPTIQKLQLLLKRKYEKCILRKQVIKMYQDPSISALNREGNTILWDWIKKHLVMEGDEKTYPEILAPLKRTIYQKTHHWVTRK